MTRPMIRAVMFDGTLHVGEVARPIPEPDEVLIRMRLAGICNTDLELLHGYKNFQGQLGHEFVGDVLEGPPEWIGRRVVGEINVACGDCDMCRRGLATHCRQRRILGMQHYDGVFSEVFRLVARNVVPVPASIPDEAAVFTEPLAAACQVLEMVHLHPTDRVVLLGAGKLGLLVAQVVRLMGVDLVVVVRRERPAALLARWAIPAVTRSDLAPESADVVIDCTGTSDGFADALDLVRPRGTILLKSSYADLPQADLTRVVVKELSVVGSRCGSFESSLRLLERGLVDVTSLIEARYSLSEAVMAFERAAQPGALKILLCPDTSPGSGG